MSRWTRSCAVGGLPIAPGSSLRQLLPPDVLAAWVRQLADCDPEIWTALRSPASATLRTASDIFANVRCPLPAARCPLPAARCPLHLAYGDTALGSVVMADEPERFVVAAPNCSATALPGHGHRIHQQSPASLADDLRTFLNGRGL